MKWVFGQPVRNDHDFWMELHKQSTNNSIVNEEDIPESISDNLNIIHESVRRIFNNSTYFSFSVDCRSSYISI